MHTTMRLQHYLLGFSLLVGALVSSLAFSTQASAVVDDDPDCDTVAIIKCGAWDGNSFSLATLRQKAAQGDVPRIYNAFDISQSDLKGEFVNGIVWRDGRVTVGGKVVATDAMTAGRHYGGTPIAGTDGAGKYSTSRFVTEGQTAWVRMVGDKFDFAVIKSCGNPVSATPKQPEQPPAPEPKMIEVCVLSTWETKTIKESVFDKSKHTKDLSLCGSIKVCVIATGEIKKIKKGEFDKTKHSKTLADCRKPSAPDMVKVCVIATKETDEIKRTEYDNTKHTEDLDKCQEETTPQVLASTGPETAIMSLFGSSALGYGAYSYFQSRRHLIAKFLGR